MKNFFLFSLVLFFLAVPVLADGWDLEEPAAKTWTEEETPSNPMSQESALAAGVLLLLVLYLGLCRMENRSERSGS